ncbi:hypothetical protein MuYL_4444 [Mucilaginibacter xinganensis]|uniref:Uncharacterized protein n=1 Tax=Mucilaginibacter xinganensis TaxID=1234841 RepID=A0A223P2F8_9SPHI|nr:hypothetical protein MuYL_4444 [Mucilaginibacter xinganensis]
MKNLNSILNTDQIPEMPDGFLLPDILLNLKPLNSNDRKQDYPL